MTQQTSERPDKAFESINIAFEHPEDNGTLSWIALQEKRRALDEARTRIKESHWIDITAIYCSATGREIARLDETALDAIPLEGMSDLNLMEQCLMSARPGMGWIIKRQMSYKHFRQHDPIGLLTHLVSVVFDALESASKRPSQEGKTYSTRWRSTELHCDFLRKKIRLFALLNELYAKRPESLLKALDHALELDARQGLHTIEPPHNFQFGELIEDFEINFIRLMNHCESELEVARLREAKAGSYLSRQMTGITAQRESPKYQALARKRKEKEQQDSMLEAFLVSSGIGTLEELQKFNESIESKTPKQDHPAVKESRISAAINERLAEYQRKTQKTRVISAGSIKL